MANDALLARLDALDLFPAHGRVQRATAREICASGPDGSVGAHCEIVAPSDDRPALRAQIVAVSAQEVRLAPFGPVDGVRIGDLVKLVGDRDILPAGADFAGRAVDALGRLIDGGPSLTPQRHRHWSPSVLDRMSPCEILVTGVRAIDGLLTLGRGQRVGIFAASGVGKTRLIEQMIRQVDCPRLVICQVGERGREVEALWSALKASGRLPDATLVAATSDESAPMRAQAIEQALAVAEFWRDRGEAVLLVVDSITRHAMALREIGLVAGEPPMARAYTPNVLRELPRIVERCGAVRGGGSITALFTVLSESDDVDDPIVEVMKSLLDGHIVLSRGLAETGHFPAIDVGKSLSRLFDRLVDDDHARSAQSVRTLLAKYEESRILVESGMYKAGSDKDLDRAIAARGGVLEFLRQRDTISASWPQMLHELAELTERRG